MSTKSHGENVTIFVLENSDTVYKGASNEHGKFLVKLNFDKTKNYGVIASAPPRRSEVIFYNPKDSCNYRLENLVFTVDITLYKICDFSDKSVYYATNDTENPENLDIYFVSELMKNPGVKLEYRQTISKTEKPEIAKKRMEQFRLYLIENGIPISNIFFSDKLYYLPESEKDQRSRIQGVILSLE